MLRLFLLVAFLALPQVIGACNSESENGVIQPPVADSLALTLEFQSPVDMGQAVPLALRVKNLEPRALNLLLVHDPFTVDFEVSDESGVTIWTLLPDIIPLAGMVVDLGPGEELVFEAEWLQETTDGDAVPVGTYFVRGVLEVSIGETPAMPLLIR